MRRWVWLAGILLALAVAIGVIEVTVKPGPIEQFRADRINANGDIGEPIAMIWSIETYSDLFYAEGPRGAAAPTQVRVVHPDGTSGAPQSTRTLDPAIHIGVCPNERPPLGTSWWSSVIPHEMAGQLRSTGQTTWHLEAYVRDRWVKVVLIDSGCRGVGRG